MQKTIWVIVFLLAGAKMGLSQDTLPAQVRVMEQGDSIRLSAGLRPLRQMAGAPAAFYTYFWELGDGRFSFDKEPVYAYRDTGTYRVRLYATNNYDDGKAPPTRPRPVKVRKTPAGRNAWASHFFHGSGEIELKVNRYPRPGENFVTVVGYRNQGADSLSGSIVLFYNERMMDREGFALADERCYNAEQRSSLSDLAIALPPTWNGQGGVVAAFTGDFSTRSATLSMLRSLQNLYTRHTVLHFSGMAPGEEKFIFLEMNTLPGMLQDTNATVSFSAMLVPDNTAAPPGRYQLDMPVVSSHDPNRFMVKSRRINYRFFRQKKPVVYRVQFENTGTGPARDVSVGIRLPKQLDPNSLVLTAVSPPCPLCDSAGSGQSCVDTVHRGDSVFFRLHHIYLPGIQQRIADPDSSTGFIEYAARFRKKPPKIPFGTQASISFDGHPPVTTNRATARFIKGLSPGIMAGYSVLPSPGGGYSATGPLQFGYVLAPYAPVRPYFQVEAFVGLLQQNVLTGPVVQDNRDTLIGGLPFLITGHRIKTTTHYNSFEVTPLHYRYNIGKYVGVGLGAMVQVDISEQTTVEQTNYFTAQGIATTSVSRTTSAVKYLGDWNAAPFADVQFGLVKGGPFIGARYIRLLKGNLTDRFFFYLGVKL
ncbi:PKD domain-containing protein [Dinghuibacter silviterrae]|uniref:PKD domain-containing protein n=1 Tax=Dinghuibacter silviterrae TaxID=1539049 RepID=A0A4R8DI59_9BACT|nr:PKD domain-containing protein [Dinghuibacter silviterrae]TDW97431.1 PKD domain-containing protein [Dinghuibacter silviterrae]